FIWPIPGSLSHSSLFTLPLFTFHSPTLHFSLSHSSLFTPPLFTFHFLPLFTFHFLPLFTFHFLPLFTVHFSLLFTIPLPPLALPLAVLILATNRRMSSLQSFSIELNNSSPI